MRYRLVLWDFDGTLADTWSCGQQIYNQIAARAASCLLRMQRPTGR